jgi:hypothetical protein
MRTRSVIKHGAEAVLEASLIATLVVGLMAATAFAGKPSAGASGTASLALRLVDDVNGNGAANWGDTITFDVSSSATSSVQVSVGCYQGGTLVYNTNAAWYSGNPFAYMQMMKLESGAWTGGAADCTAKSYYSSGKRTITLRTLSFHVDA